MLPALELIERAYERIAVREVDDEPQRHLLIGEMV